MLKTGGNDQFTTGIGITYQPSLIVAPSAGSTAPSGDDPHATAGSIVTAGSITAARSAPSLATGCKPGTRFPSYQVLSQADARPWQLHHHMPSDGRFRLVVFGGDVSAAAQRKVVNDLGRWARTALLPRFGPVEVGVDPHHRTIRLGEPSTSTSSVVDLLLVH